MSWLPRKSGSALACDIITSSVSVVWSLAGIDGIRRLELEEWLGCGWSVTILSFPLLLLPERFLASFVVEADKSENRPSKLSLLNWRVGEGRGCFTPQVMSEFTGPTNESGVIESSLDPVMDEEWWSVVDGVVTSGGNVRVGVASGVLSNGVISPVCMSLCLSVSLLTPEDGSKSEERESSLPDNFLRSECSLACSVAIWLLYIRMREGGDKNIYTNIVNMSINHLYISNTIVNTHTHTHTHTHTVYIMIMVSSPTLHTNTGTKANPPTISDSPYYPDWPSALSVSVWQ